MQELKIADEEDKQNFKKKLNEYLKIISDAPGIFSNYFKLRI